MDGVDDRAELLAESSISGKDRALLVEARPCSNDRLFRNHLIDSQCPRLVEQSRGLQQIQLRTERETKLVSRT